MFFSLQPSLGAKQYFYWGLNPRIKLLGWPNGSGDSLQSCYIWVQFPSPALRTNAKLSGDNSSYCLLFLNSLASNRVDVFKAVLYESRRFWDVLATLQTNSSSLNSMGCVWTSVFLMFLCPTNRITWRMSLILAYSVVLSIVGRNETLFVASARGCS